MKTKKIFALILATLMLGMLLCGCGKGGVFVNQIYGGANVDGEGSEYSGEELDLVGAWGYEEGNGGGAVIEFLENGEVNFYSVFGESIAFFRSGTYVVKGDKITVYSEDDPDGEECRFSLEDGVLTLIEDEETLELTPYHGTLDKNTDINDVIGGITGNLDGSDSAAEEKIEEYVDANEYELIRQFESGFTTSGLTCETEIEAVGTGFVIDVVINEFVDLTEEMKTNLQITYDSMSETFETALKTMQQELPEMTYYTVNVRAKNGEIAAVVTAGNR